MFGEDPVPSLEWTPTLWGSIVLMVIASPLFFAYRLLQDENLGGGIRTRFQRDEKKNS